MGLVMEEDMQKRRRSSSTFCRVYYSENVIWGGGSHGLSGIDFWSRHYLILGMWHAKRFVRLWKGTGRVKGR